MKTKEDAYHSLDNWHIIINRKLTSKIIGMYSIFYELSQSVLMHIDATRLTMMNVAFHDGWIGAGFHFKAGNSIVMDVILLEISLWNSGHIMLGTFTCVKYVFTF